MGKLNRKSQVTVFIVVGIILLFATAVIVSLWSTHLDKYLGNIGNDDPKLIKNYVDSCLKTMANDWLYVHGLYTGNYYGISEDYGLNDNSIIMPDIEETKKGLEMFLSENVNFCMPKDTRGYNITARIPAEFHVRFQENLVLISYNNIYSAEKEESFFTSGTGGFELRKRVKIIIDDTNRMIEERRVGKYIKDSDNLQQKETDYELWRDNENSEHWLVTDKAGTNQEYQFAFVVWVDK